MAQRIAMSIHRGYINSFSDDLPYSSQMYNSWNCVDKMVINIYLKWARIFFLILRKWKEKYVQDRYWHAGPKFSRWLKVSRSGSYNQGKISRSYSSAFLEMTPSSVCGRVWPTWISDSGTWGPGKVPKTIWPRRIHTVIGKLKRKIPHPFFKRSFGRNRESPKHLLT